MSRVEIWTDGSAFNNGDRVGGIGVVMVYKDHVKELSEGYSNTTNNKMEMLAVIRGLETMKTKKIPVYIYSDSAYVVNCFKQKWYESWMRNGWKKSDGRSVKNRDLWERLINLYFEQRECYFVKVKGHIGIELNERADELASIGADKERLKVKDTDTITELINRRRRQILVHSFIYYRLNNSLIDDHTFDKWCMELVHLQKEFSEIAKKCVFPSDFKDFDGSSGYDLPLADEWVVSAGYRLLNSVKKQNKGEDFQNE